MTILDNGIARIGPRSRLAARHPTAYLALQGLFGLVAAMVLLWIFLALAEDIPEHGALVRLDLAAAHWLELHGTETGESVFVWVSYLGSPVLAASVVAAAGWFAWKRDWLRAGAVALTTAGGVAVDTLLKIAFHRGRPETATEFITRQSWSFPSGHSMNSLIGYGFLAFLLLERTSSASRRALTWLAAIVLIVGIGFSRMYLGVHYLSDVVGGWVAGATWLLVCIGAYRVAEWNAAARGRTRTAGFEASRATRPEGR